MPGYQGPPRYAKVPITGRERGYDVGQRDVPFHEALDAPGTEGLTPFPPTPGCPPEEVPQRPECVPGRGTVVDKGLSVFSVWQNLDANGNVLPETPPLHAYQMLKSPPRPGQHAESLLWMVELWGYEVARRRTAAEGAVSPLGASAITGVSALEAENRGNAMTRLKVRLTTHGASGGSVRIIDIGEGIRLTIEACAIEIELLYPQPGTVQVDGRPNLQLGAGGGLVLDSEIGGFIAESTSTPGAQVCTNTVTVRVPAGAADQAVFVPPGTRWVTIYQTGVGAVMTPEWRLFRAVADIGPSLGTILLGGDRRVVQLDRLGNAGMITTGPADPDNDRVATFVFSLEI